MKLQEDATIEDFYRIMQDSPLVRNAFTSNSHVYRVELQSYDGGSSPVRFAFETPQGFVQDQRERRGAIELKTE